MARGRKESDALSREELTELRRSLSMLSTDGRSDSKAAGAVLPTLERFYRQAHERCVLQA
jgi:hypothetical protein